MPLALPATSYICSSAILSYVAEIRNSLFTRMVTYPPLKVLLTYPFQLPFKPNITKSLVIPVGMYVYFITYPSTPIKSLAAILN
jgi:hypothetical protein